MVVVSTHLVSHLIREAIEGKFRHLLSPSFKSGIKDVGLQFPAVSLHPGGRTTLDPAPRMPYADRYEQRRAKITQECDAD